MHHTSCAIIYYSHCVCLLINAQQILEKDFSPIDDMRASSRYRMEIAKNLLLKLYLEIKNKQNIRINE